jgi:hypothetical protein
VRRARTSPAFFILAGAVVVALVMLRSLIIEHSARVKGYVTGDGLRDGPFSFDVSTCTAGRMPDGRSLGVDLWGWHWRGEERRGIRAITGADAAIWVSPDGGVTRLERIGRQDCSEWELRVEPTAAGNAVRGEVSATCAFHGGTVVARVAFDGCKL